MKFVSVLQGECRVSAEPDVVFTTVLGSCVAVCLHDPVAKLGGLNHFLLPGGAQQSQRDMRFGIHSMELLINDMLKRGAMRRRLEAKVFGGARVIESSSNIGQSNIVFATEFLAREGIPCVGRDLGGRLARRLKFLPAHGEVTHNLVAASEGLDRAPAAVPQRPAPAPDITLF